MVDILNKSCKQGEKMMGILHYYTFGVFNMKKRVKALNCCRLIYIIRNDPQFSGLCLSFYTLPMMCVPFFQQGTLFFTVSLDAPGQSNRDALC